MRRMPLVLDYGKQESFMVKKGCTSCGLHKYRRNIVKGRGNIPAKLLLIGEAPGRSEDLIGQAFIGPAGKLLDRMLHEAEINCTYYIINTVLCRPCDDRKGDNREPKASEVLACTSNVLQLIGKVKPEKVIFVGKVAQRYYKKEFPNALTILHPAFLLRQGGPASPYYTANLRAIKSFMKGIDNGTEETQSG